jgi:enamine deaminase RidA (YjgF/YER057c/UK114 family)
MSFFRTINPGTLGKPRGFSHGLLSPPGHRVLFIAGQTAADERGRVIDSGFAAQFAVALARTIAVLEEAGGRAEHIGRMTVYVTDMDAYRDARPALGEIWTRRMGTHYPAMALVEVQRLVDVDAIVEIEATAMIP